MTSIPKTVEFQDESDAWLIKEAILDELGEVVFERLCESFGGQEIAIPANASTISETHFLAQAIGVENAQVLAEATGPARYYVPNLTRKIDGDKLVSMMNAGLANWEIAKRLGCSERNVRRRLSEKGLQNPNRKPRSRAPVLAQQS